VIRIAPPLVIQCEEIDWAFERIRKVIEKPVVKSVIESSCGGTLV
jgi:acetylornithine/succinyldiaminopimelate/putrescine aminotransferase